MAISISEESKESTAVVVSLTITLSGPLLVLVYGHPLLHLHSRREVRKAVRLWGAADVLAKDIGARISSSAQTRYDQQVGKARAVLGADGFSTEWEAGLALTYEQAAAYALEE